MRLGKGEKVISLIVVAPGHVLSVTENGYGKRTAVEEFPSQQRGGKGVIAIKTSERNGMVVGAQLVNEGDEVMLISDSGTLVRIAVDEISVVRRNTQGVRVIRLDPGSRLVSLDRAVDDNGANGNGKANGSANGSGEPVG